jgi:hypothetical protein
VGRLFPVTGTAVTSFDRTWERGTRILVAAVALMALSWASHPAAAQGMWLRTAKDLTQILANIAVTAGVAFAVLK